MKITALLCNHAEVQNNLLYISGAGIDRSVVPPGSPGPWGVTLGIAIMVGVPWTQTNQQHTLTVDLHDADGHPVEVPTGPDTKAPFRAELGFNVGRPPHLQVGEDQTVCLAVNIPGLPLHQIGSYRFTIDVDGSPEVELPFHVATLPGVTVGFGPTSLPGM